MATPAFLTLNLILLYTLVGSIATSKFQDDRLNVLFLMADQLRADAVGCYGSKLAKTPNLDWLASQGARFTNAYSTTPTCTPARTAILTGLSPWYHGLLSYGAIAHHYPTEMPSTFAANGYYTYSIGKDHFGWDNKDDRGIPHGYNGTDVYDGLEEIDDYDQWFAKQLPGADPLATGLGWNDHGGRVYVYPEYYHPTSWVGRKTVQFIESYNRKEPFFLKASFHRPHSPYDPPGRFMNQFRPQDMPKPYLGGNWDANCNFTKALPSALCCGNVGEDSIAVSRQCYYGNVAFVDEWIGRIITTLRNASLLEKTVILFVADHGDMLGDHFRWRKSLPYESSAKIPMIFVWPPALTKSPGASITVPRGSVKDEVVELRDIFPTFLDATGLSIPKSLNGSSLLNLLKSKSSPSDWREYIDLEHGIYCNKTFHWNGYSDGKTKYIFRAYYADEQLFDLSSDPHEMHNLAGDPEWQDTLKTWRERLVKQFEEEQRGPEWVKDGVLQKRVKSQTHSPHYPGNTASCSRNLMDLPATDFLSCT